MSDKWMNRCMSCDSMCELRCVTCLTEKIERDVTSRIVAYLRSEANDAADESLITTMKVLQANADAIECGKWKQEK